jgi:hypothetical protein
MLKRTGSLETNKEMEEYLYGGCSENWKKGGETDVTSTVLLDRSCLPLKGLYTSDWAVQVQDTQLHNGVAILLSKAVTSEWEDLVRPRDLSSRAQTHVGGPHSYRDTRSRQQHEVSNSCIRNRRKTYYG